MRFDLKSRQRLVLSNSQYPILREFYNEGADFTMPVEEWTRIHGGTLNSFLPPPAAQHAPSLLQLVYRQGSYRLKMTSEGRTFMAQFENKHVYRDHPYSKQFPVSVREMPGFKLAQQKLMLAKAHHILAEGEAMRAAAVLKKNAQIAVLPKKSAAVA
jgi:hypothetical protein